MSTQPRWGGRNLPCPVYCPNRNCTSKDPMVEDGAGYNKRGPVASFSCMTCNTFLDVNMNITTVTHSLIVQTVGEAWIAALKVYDLRAEWSLVDPKVWLMIDYMKNGFERSDGKKSS